MKEQKGIASPQMARNIYMDVDLFTNTVLEYVGYLRSRVPKDDKGRRYCRREEHDYHRCWGKAERFCEMRGLDCKVFMDVLVGFGVLFDCESCVATYFDSAVFFKTLDEPRGALK